jgi:phospholipid/cholesterol/gamma-HCH transport system permease protein
VTRSIADPDAAAAMPGGLPGRGSPLTLREEGDRASVAGALVIDTLPDARAAIELRSSRPSLAALDLSGLESLDTPGALFLCELRERGVELIGARAEHAALLDLVCGLNIAPMPAPKEVSRVRELVIDIGKGGDAFWRDTLDVIAFIGRAAEATLRALVRPRYLRLAAISRQVEETGVDALPIIALMAIMISIVIGYQGVAQLRPYGGEDLTVNLVAVSMLREMGVLITAIMVAGRSGSAFTAELGVMKAREEIDALEVMGMDPIEMLVVPRVIGLVITLPLLTFFADIMGLVGGGVIAQALLHISPLQSIDRLRHAVDTGDAFVGLVKAPIFAFLIAAIGCMHGLRVRGSAESVGRETTRAVVKSIFLVIVLDAIFSILFEKLGL